ncbi:hypothetical protein D3C80_2184780 [compost metagenome]
MVMTIGQSSLLVCQSLFFAGTEQFISYRQSKIGLGKYLLYTRFCETTITGKILLHQQIDH